MTKSRAELSCRHAGAVGSKPTAVTKFMLENYRPDVGMVLDFGSGKVPVQTNLLVKEGYDVRPYDLMANRVDGVHVQNGEYYITSWKVILLSNVVNVQETVWDAAFVVVENLKHAEHAVIFNLPNDPIYWATHSTARGNRRKLEHMLNHMGITESMYEKRRYSGGMIYHIRKA